MSKIATRYVHTIDKDGAVKVYGPGDTIPDSAGVTNPKVFQSPAEPASGKVNSTGPGNPTGFEPDAWEDDADAAAEGVYAAMTVDQLKGELAGRDLALSGSKAELIGRLEQHDAEFGDGS